ncbi:MAG: DUF2391 family protein [Nanoarchaeota archaeon]
MKDGIQHFSREDFFYSFFGALFVGFVFMSKGFLIDIAKNLTNTHLIIITVLTLIFTTTQIYFVGYTRVHDKVHRGFGEFWAKRFITVYVASIVVSLILIYVYGINKMIGSDKIINAVVAFSMPCSLGATLSDLVKKIKF